MDNAPKVGRFSRRKVLAGAAGVAGVGALGSVLIGSQTAMAAENGHGLTIVENESISDRLEYFRFSTEEIGWDPGVNVLLPEGYHDSGKRYPVLYMLHGGAGQFTDFHNLGIVDLTAGKDVIVVMPDASCGWYSNPVSSNTGPRNWETFHINQLLPWIDANFRTYAEYDGRAVAGFSMGGFGALKYAAKYHGHFSCVSSHSGPASLRRDAGLVVHWANVTSAAVDLGGGTVYGAPLWDEARVDADNPMQRIDSYHNKRIFMVCGDSPDPLDLFGQINEWQVGRGQKEFGAALDKAGIPYERHDAPGGHVFRPDYFTQDLDGMLERMRTAA